MTHQGMKKNVRKMPEGGRGQIGPPRAQVILGTEMARVPKRTGEVCWGRGGGRERASAVRL